MNPSLPATQSSAAPVNGQQTPGPRQMTRQNVLELLRQDVATLIREQVNPDLDPEKSRQRMRLQRADLYNRGIQNIAPGVDMNTGSIGWRSVGGSSSAAADSGILDYNLDITKSYQRKYTSILGLRPFYNSKSLPDNPQSETDRNAARQAELGALWLRDVWNCRLRNIEIFHGHWCSGTQYVYLPFVADADTFGETEETIYGQTDVELQPATYVCPNCGAEFAQPQQSLDALGLPADNCPECGNPIQPHDYQPPQHVAVPQPAGTVKYPAAGPKFVLTNGFFVTIPMDVVNFDRKPYILYEMEDFPGELLRIYGAKLRRWLDPDTLQFKAQNRDLTPEDENESARSSIYSLTGSITKAQSNLRWTHSRIWLDPSQYELVKNQQKKAILKQYFPSGLKVCAVEGCIVDLVDEYHADHWEAIAPEAGNSVYHDPVCWMVLPHQDVTNHLANIMIAYGERGLPTAAIDPDVFDLDIFSKPFRPYEIIPAKAGAGGRLQNSIATLPTATFPEHLPGVLSMVQDNYQTHTGLLPVAWGGMSAGNKTADQFRNELNQALQQLGVPGEYVAQAWSRIFLKAMKLMEKYATTGPMVATSQAMGGSSEMMDIEALRAGKYHYQSEVGIPMSWAERKSALELIIGQNPNLATAMELDAPRNAAAIRDMLLPNQPEITSTQQNLRDKVAETIQLLLEGQATQQPMPDGTVQYIPSIQPEPFVDDPSGEAMILHEWLIDPAGRNMQKQNPTGWRNVVAYGMACDQIANPPMPPPMPGQEGAPTPEGGPPAPAPKQNPAGPQKGPGPAPKPPVSSPSPVAPPQLNTNLPPGSPAGLQ